MTELQELQRQLSEIADSLSLAVQQERNGVSATPPDTPAPQDRRTREDALIEQIEKAYRDLAATRRKLARAELAKRRHETRVKVDNADTLMAAKNERTQGLYIEGLLDTDEYRKLADQEKAAELDHFDARAEVDRLQLTVKLLRTTTSGADDPEAGR